jgi:hypothetical protein
VTVGSTTSGWQLSFRGESFQGHLRSALFAIDEIRFRDLNQKNPLSLLADFFPRHSTSLTRNLTKSLFSIEDPLLLVLTVHLYFDHTLLVACRRAGLSRRTQNSFFANRLSELERHGHVPAQIAASMRVLNRLRNSFAHDLLFDMASWDPRSFAFIGAAYRREPKRRPARAQKHLLLFRIAVLALLYDLHHHWSWLYLEGLPQTRTRTHAPIPDRMTS